MSKKAPVTVRSRKWNLRVVGMGAGCPNKQKRELPKTGNSLFRQVCFNTCPACAEVIPKGSQEASIYKAYWLYISG